MLAHSEGTNSGKQAPKWDSGTEERPDEAEPRRADDEPLFKAPPRNAMAGVLITDWAHGKVDLLQT